MRPVSKKRKLGYSVLLIVLLGVDAYALLFVGNIVLNYGNPFDLGTQQTTMPVVFSYDVRNKSISETPDVTFALFLRTSQIIIAGQEVKVSATVAFNTNDTNLSNAKAVGIGFVNALEYPLQNDSRGIPSQAILVLNAPLVGNKSIWTGGFVPLTFAQQGDYQPFAVIQGPRFSTGYILGKTAVVHVEPQSSLWTFQFNKINIALSIALLFFAMMESAKFVIALYERITAP